MSSVRVVAMFLVLLGVMFVAIGVTLTTKTPSYFETHKTGAGLRNGGLILIGSNLVVAVLTSFIH